MRAFAYKYSSNVYIRLPLEVRVVNTNGIVETNSFGLIQQASLSIANEIPIRNSMYSAVSNTFAERLSMYKLSDLNKEDCRFINNDMPIVLHENNVCVADFSFVRYLANLLIGVAGPTTEFRVVITSKMVQEARAKNIHLMEGTFTYLQPFFNTNDKLAAIYGRAPNVQEFRSLAIQAIIGVTPEVALRTTAGVGNGMNGDPYLVLKMMGMDFG